MPIQKDNIKPSVVITLKHHAATPHPPPQISLQLICIFRYFFGTLQTYNVGR